VRSELGFERGAELLLSTSFSSLDVPVPVRGFGTHPEEQLDQEHTVSGVQPASSTRPRPHSGAGRVLRGSPRETCARFRSPKKSSAALTIRLRNSPIFHRYREQVADDLALHPLPKSEHDRSHTEHPPIIAVFPGR